MPRWELSAAPGASPTLHQRAQKAELRRGELYFVLPWLTTCADTSTLSVPARRMRPPQATAFLSPCVRRRIASTRRTRSRGLEGFGQVVVGTQLEISGSSS